jgi:hypothetical protein
MNNRDSENQDTPEYLRRLAESLSNPVVLDICTYQVSGTSNASVKLVCSKNIDEFDAESLIKVWISNISSTYCSVSEDDLEFEWKNCSEVPIRDDDLDCLQYVDFEGEVFLKKFKIELGVAFSSQGKEVDLERFLDNLILNADSFIEALDESYLTEAKDLYLEIVDSSIEPFEFDVDII